MAEGTGVVLALGRLHGGIATAHVKPKESSGVAHRINARVSKISLVPL